MVLASADIHVTVIEVWVAEAWLWLITSCSHQLSFVDQAAEPHPSSHGQNMSGVSAVLTTFPATVSVTKTAHTSHGSLNTYLVDLNTRLFSKYFFTSLLFTAALCFCQPRRAGLGPSVHNIITKTLFMFVILHEHEPNNTYNFSPN